MKDLKAVTNKDEFFGKMKEYEQLFYGSYEKSVQDNLLDELKKKQFQPETHENQGFLRPPTQAEKDYMQGQYRYNKFSRQKDDEQSMQLRQNFQVTSEGQFNTYVPPKYNYVDVQANSKQFFPDQEMFIKDFNRPQQSFSNAQNIYLNRNVPANIQGQEVKNVFPTKLFHPHDQEISHPFFLAQEAPSQALRNNIQKLGGIQDTLTVMEPSLREHERQAFYEKGKYDLFSHNSGVNDAAYKPFPEAAVISNIQNRPHAAAITIAAPEPTIVYNPFERNPYTTAQQQKISPMPNPMHEQYSSASAYQRQQNMGGYGNSSRLPPNGQPSNRTLTPTGVRKSYDNFLNLPSQSQQRLQNMNGYGGDQRNQFDSGPIFINNAQRF